MVVLPVMAVKYGIMGYDVYVGYKVWMHGDAWGIMFGCMGRSA